MSTIPLEPVIEEIIREGQRIRILVVGKTGTGKTSLIKKIFKVGTLEPSHNRAGICDIEKELVSKDNERFVIHDSQGYEPGDETKFKELTAFIERRCHAPKLSDRVHVIWLCIEVPYAGGRVLEKGTEDLLRLVPKDIAMVVVFTKYDRLVLAMEDQISDSDIDDDEFDMRCRSLAEKALNQRCAPLLKIMSETGYRLLPIVNVSVKGSYAPTLSELVQVTEEHIQLVERTQDEISEEEPHESSDGVGFTSVTLMASAQRVNMDSKVTLAIRVGKKKYWRGLASGTHFPGLGMRECLAVLHKDIVIPWNIPDPDKLLISEEFESCITRLVQDLDKFSNASGRKALSKGVALAGTISGVAGAVSGPVAPIVAPTVFAATFFAHWVYETYTTTPHTVRCLMGYIVHLTNVMQRTFHETLQGHAVSKESVATVVEKYSSSRVFGSVRDDIADFVAKTKTFRFADKDYVLDELVRLINEHRYTPCEAT